MKKIITSFALLIQSITFTFAQTNYEPNVTVSTFAGSRTTGSADGQGTAANFTNPYGVCVDASGNVYVADAGNNKIRKISPGGLVSTLAGAGQLSPGSADGQGTVARFNNPRGICVDASGNVYVADADNHKIRKISPSGLVSTLSGSGTQGSDDGQGTAASFNGPTGVCVDASGNLYVADQMNNKIRKISPSGLVSTFAGSGSQGSADGQGTAASFYYPHGVCVDASGNVYVADYNNNKIRKISPSGLVSTLAGGVAYGSADGQGMAASFRGPNGVCLDASGNVYVADTYNQKIRKISPSGLVSTLAGSGTQGSDDGQGTSASFNGPFGVCVDASGNVYIADYTNLIIRKITIGSANGIETTTISSLNIYPNPAQNILHLQLNESIQGTVSITDLQGQTILSQAINDNNAQINTSNVANGVYVLKVVSEKASYTKQVVISR